MLGRQEFDMQKLVLPLFSLVFLIMQGGPAPAATPEPLTAALTAARADSGVPFHLRVNCTERDSRRSLEVIRGSVAVWGNHWQVRLAAKDRAALIDMLLDADFAHCPPLRREAEGGQAGSTVKSVLPDSRCRAGSEENVDTAPGRGTIRATLGPRPAIARSHRAAGG